MKWISWSACAAVSALTLTAATALYLRSEDIAPQVSAGTVNSQTSSEAQAAPGLPDWHLQEGAVVLYDLVDKGWIKGGAGPDEVALAGVLKLEVLQATAQGHLVWLSFTADHTQRESASPAKAGQASLNAMVPILARGTLAVMAAKGMNLASASSRDAASLHLPALPSDSAAERFWQALFDRLRTDWPASGPERQLRNTEMLGNTQVEAAYKFVGSCLASAAEPASIEKTWRATTASTARSTGSSSARFQPGCQGLAAWTWSGEEAIASGNAALSAHTEISLRWRSQDRVAAGVVRDRLNRDLAKAPTLLAPASSSIDSAAIGGLDEGQLFTLLRQHDGREELSQDLYLQLKSWLALHPDTMARLRALTRDMGPADQRLRGFIKALGAVGSPEAQGALVGMIKDAAAHPELQSRLITTLGFVLHPTPATVDAIVDIAEHSSDAMTGQRARMAAGVLGSRLRTSSDTIDQQRAQALEQHLAGWLKSNPSALYDTLAALGNLGPHAALIRGVLDQGGSPQIRAQAYFALRFSPEGDVSGYLARAYQSEQGPGLAQIRSEIVRSLAMRPVDASWFDAVSQFEAKTMPPGEAQVLGQALARAASVDPGRSKAALDRLSDSTSDADTKKALAALRDGLSSH